MTNAEHIRRMADEELADFIINGCWGIHKKIEKPELIAWLQEEDSIPADQNFLGRGVAENCVGAGEVRGGLRASNFKIRRKGKQDGKQEINL